MRYDIYVNKKMGEKSMLPAEKRLLDKIMEAGQNLPQDVVGLTPQFIIQVIRKRLRMTQTQLAKRLKLTQSHYSKIESGKLHLTIDTFEKILRGLGFTLAIVPVAACPLDEVLEKQAFEAAQKKVKYIVGTMSLEDQKPSLEAINEMIEEEKKKLLDSKTSKIWDFS